MDTPQQYPTMWTTGYIGSVKVSFTFPIRNEMDAYAQAKAITDKLLADGFTTTEPGLEAGEQKEQIGWIARRAKSDGTPILDLYLDNEKWVNRLVMCYLDDAEGIKAFENATGLTLDSIPLYDGDRLERGNTDKARKYIVRVAKPTLAVIKDNPHYNPDETDIKKKKPARLFIRWVTDAPQTAPAAAANASPAEPEPPRNARLQNEELVITTIKKTGVVSGNKDPNKNGFKYEGWGKIDDNGQKFDVRVWIFPEDIKEIAKSGREWHEGSDNYLPIIMDTTDRNMTRIASVIPKETPTTERAWDAAAWDAVVDYCALNGVMPKDVLNVDRGSQWKRGYDAAIKAIDTYVAKRTADIDFMAEMPKAAGQ